MARLGFRGLGVQEIYVCRVQRGFSDSRRVASGFRAVWNYNLWV